MKTLSTANLAGRAKQSNSVFSTKDARDNKGHYHAVYFATQESKKFADKNSDERQQEVSETYGGIGSGQLSLVNMNLNI